MKRLITYIFLISLLGLNACDSFLDEELKDTITVENYYQSDAEVDLAVNGLYSILHNGNLYGTRGLDNFYINGTDITGPSRNVNGAVHNYLIAEGVADGKATWSKLYELAKNATSILDALVDNDKLSEEAKLRFEGEALFVRALTYFHLTNMWGDVPYFRELPSVNELSVIERTSKDLIRKDMKTDLERAFGLLPTDYEKEGISKGTKWAAATLLAKYHLFDKEWDNAKKWCDEVIDNGPHSLLDNFEDLFDRSNQLMTRNNEQIFVIDYASNAVSYELGTRRTDDYNPRIRDEPANGAEKNALKAALKANGDDMTGFGWAIPLPELADASNWQAGDLRYDATIVQEYEGFTLKFPYFRKNWNLDQTQGSTRMNHSENYVVFRLADVYLMAAEAANELNDASAVQYVDEVRKRAFEPDQPLAALGLDQNGLRERIRDERKWELCAEGYRKTDLVRWGILIDVVQNVQHRSWNNPGSNIKEHHVLMPIPLDEILLNENLLTSDPTNNGYRGE